MFLIQSFNVGKSNDSWSTARSTAGDDVKSKCISSSWSSISTTTIPKKCDQDHTANAYAFFEGD